MTDVPAWVLVLNTVAAGGFGLLGTYIVPRAQREARAAEDRRANAAVMRDKAEAIFQAIAEMEDAAHQHMLHAVSTALGENPEPGPMIKFDKARALAAVYYPNLLPIMDKFELPPEKRMERVEAITAAARKGDRPGMVRAAQDMRSRSVEQGEKLFLAASQMTRELRTQLIADVRPYLPEA